VNVIHFLIPWLHGTFFAVHLKLFVFTKICLIPVTVHWHWLRK